MANDGTITFSVWLDAEDTEKELASIKKKIHELEMQLNTQNKVKSGLEEQLQRAGAAADKAKAKLEELRRSGASAAAIKEQEGYVKAYDQDFNKAADALDRQNAKIDETTKKIETQKEAYGQLEKEAVKARHSGSSAQDEVSKRLDKLTGKIATLAKRVFFFTLFTRAFRAIRNYVGSALQTNEEFVAATARLRAALLTAFQPIYSAAVPALISLINTLSSAISVIAQFVSLLFGSTVEASAAAAESLDAEAKALDAVGGGAKKAGKSLANFDEINQLSSSSGGGGGGGKAASNGFEVSPGALDSWDDLGQKILGVTGIVAALGLAFGSVAGGIAAVIGGLSLFTDGFRDAEKNGMNLYNTLEMVAGLLISGIGISVLTGSWIPMLVAGLADAVLGIAYFTGHGDELISGLSLAFEGLSEFVSGVFAGDWGAAMAGLEKAGDGFKLAWDAIVKSIKDAWKMLLDWLKKPAQDEFSESVSGIKNFLIGLYRFFKTVFTGILQFLAGVFSGDWELTWTGIKNIFIGILNGIITAFEAGINLMIDGINGAQKLLLPLMNKIPGINVGLNQAEHITLPRIPALAAGAVIPPNREFLAVLGDQSSGTNIEAPLDTIVAAFRAVMRENGGTRQPIILQVDRRELGRIVFDAYNTESSRVGVEIGGFA